MQTRPVISRFVIDCLTQKIFWLSALLQAFGTQSVFTQEDLANMVGENSAGVSRS